MSIVLQWTIGCAAALAAAVLLAVFRKESRVACCVASAILAGFLAFGLLKGPELFGDSKTAAAERSSAGKETAADDSALQVIAVLLDGGDIDAADTLLDEYAGSGNYSREYLTLLADVEKEKENRKASAWIRSALEETGSDLKELEKSWKDPDKNARLAAEAYQAARQLSRTDSFLQEDRDSLMDSLSGWIEKGAPHASSLPSLNRTWLAAELYENNYTELAEKVSEDPDGDTLIVVSQLFRNNSLDERSFEKAKGRKAFTRDAEEAAAWLEREIEKNDNAYTEEELEFLEQKKDEFSETAKGGKSAVEKYLISQMEEKAEERGETSSKLYLELADRAYEEGEKDKGAEYLAKSLETAASSEDGDYTAAARHLNEILSDTSDPEIRKQIDQYTKEMADNRMPLLVSDPLEEARMNAPAYATDAGYTEGEDGRDDREEDGWTGDERQEAEEQESQDLASSMTNSLNQSLGAINIAQLNTDDFPQIRATVAVDESVAKDEDEFRNDLILTDTDYRIRDFEVTKAQYDTVNVVLVCDVSGSMSGEKIDYLKEAVRQFVDNSDADVNIALVPFNGGVVDSQTCRLGADSAEILDVVDELRADGDTNIYTAVTYAADFFPSQTQDLNMMLLLSDGQSNYPASVDEYEALQATCIRRGISIYAVGLGSDVDANQMSEFAGYGGGEYYFISSPDAILDFYNYIYRLSKNRYFITYEAYDTMQMSGRYMELVSAKNRAIQARRDYSLYSNDLEKDFRTPISVTAGDTVLFGLKEKTIYPTAVSQTLTLLGKNIAEDAEISVELNGTASFSALSVEWQDENTCSVVIPGRVPTDVYDVVVTYNGLRRVFQKSLIVAGNDTSVVKFGKYVFTATNCDRGSGSVVLSGVVRMNGWLGYLDPVTLTGDLENDYEITMDCGKTYLQYTNGAQGLAGHYANMGYTLSLPYFTSLQLYNDPSKDVSDEDFPVRAAAPDAFYSIIDGFNLEATTYGLSLYPDRAEIRFQEFTTKLPFQDVLIRNMGADKIFHFQPEHEEALIFSDNAIDCDIHFKLSNNRDDEFAGTLGNMNLMLNLDEFSFDLNTRDGDVAVTLKANIAMLCDGVGFKLAWKDWKFDEVGLYADYEIQTYIGTFPVTLHNFKLEASDISKVDLGNDLSSLFEVELKGGLDISLIKISSAFPGLEKWIGDASIAALKNCELGFRLKNFRIQAKADAEVLGFIDLGHAEAELGFDLDYTNPLLKFQDKPNGFAISVEAGPEIKLDNVELDLRARCAVPITDRIIGLGLGGSFYAKISWWVFVKDFRADGDLFIGTYRQTDDNFCFLVVGRGIVNGGKQDSFCVTWGDKDKILSTVDL